MVRLRAAALIAFALVDAAGCSLLVKTDDLVSGAGGDGGRDPDGGGVPDRAPPCSADLNSDSMNCGACGRSCLGAGCMSGRCLPLTVASEQGRPMGIAVYVDLVFWVNQVPPSLLVARKDGTGLRRLERTADALQDPFDIASDGQFVYWTEVTSNTVFRKPVNDGPKTSFIPGPGTAAFLVVDGGQVYVSGMGSIIDNRNVLFMEPDTVSGLAVHGGVIFWGRQMRSEVMAGSTAGAGAGMPTLFAPAQGMIKGVAADADFVYWIEGGQRVRKRARTGAGTLATLYEAVQPFGDSDITVDDTAVYWTERGVRDNEGFVRRMAK